MHRWRGFVYWLNKRIATKLLAAFIFLIVTPVLFIGVISFKLSEDMILDKVGTSAAKTLEQSSSSINHILDSMIYVSNSVNLNESIKAILNKETSGDIRERWTDFQTIDNVFATINSTYFPYASYFTIIGRNDRVYTSWSRSSDSVQRIEQEPWYSEIVTNEFLWIPSHSSYLGNFDAESGPLLTLSRYIYEDIGMKTYGVFIVSVPHRQFLGILQQANSFPGSRLLVLNQDNEPIIYGDPEDRLLFERLHVETPLNQANGSFVSTSGQQDYMVNYHRLKRNAWKIVEIIPYASMLGEITELRSKLVFFLALFIALFLVISAVLAVSITTPIRKLYQSMKQVERGDWSVRVDVKSHDEIGMLVRNFNQMVAHVQELIDKLYEEQDKKRELEIEALQAQIEPHFLFNTLNSIRWVAIMSESGNVSEMIGALTHLLKMSISTKDKLITIEAEIENAKHYILIQKVRYNTRFETVFDIDPDIAGLKIIKLILQPVIENAILHGVGKQRGGIIEITGRREGGDIVLAIRDNGQGMEERRVRELMRAIYSGQRSSRGIGLSNVNQRLVLSYGEQYGLSIRSAPGEGTIVVIRIPAVE